MLKDLLKEGGLYTLANILTKGVGLLLIPFYTSYFSTQDYGIIDVISVFGAMLTTIISLQLNQGMGRYVADSKTSTIKKKQYASTAILVVTIISLCVGAILISFPNQIISFLSTKEAQIPEQTFIYSIWAIILGSLYYFLGVYMRFLRLVKAFSILTFCYALFGILAMLYFVIIKNMGIDSVYLSGIIASPIAIIISLYILRNHIILYIGKIEFKNIFTYSAPLIPASVAYLLMNTIDRWYIKDLLSFDEVGIYGIAFKFSTIITIILTGFTMAMNPITFQKYTDENYKIELAKILKYFIGIGSFGLLVLSLFSLETIIIFTNDQYLGSAKIMPILYLSVILTGLGMFSPGINIKNKTKAGAIIIIISSILNIALNYYFIIWFGLIGAAISTLIAVIFYYVTYYKVAQHYYKLDLDFKKYIYIILLMLTFIYLGCYVINFNFTINLIIKTTFVLLYGIVVYVKIIKQNDNNKNL